MNKSLFVNIFSNIFSRDKFYVWVALCVCAMLLPVSAPLMAGDIKVPRVSPMPYGGDAISLSGMWAFSEKPQPAFPRQAANDSWHKIEVPGEWTMQGYTVAKGQSAGYERHFAVPESWRGKRVKLRCDGVYSECRVFVNGNEAGSHFGGFTRFEIDVTRLVKFGEDNRLSLLVKSEGLADSTSSASNYAYHPLGGISRKISLLALPETNFSMLHVSTTFDSLYTDAKLRVEATVANESASNVKDCGIEVELLDADGNAVAVDGATRSQAAMSPGGLANVDMLFDVRHPRHWDCEHPYLYTLVARLVRGGKTIATASRRVGFRQIEVRGNEVFVNGRAVKLRGVCRHEVMPLRGRSLDSDMWRRDVELFRNGNVNYIRTSHYPPAEELLDACDSMGMFVEVEAPFCWAHQTKVSAKDEDRLITQHAEMVNAYRSHPSVLMWSIANESVDFKQYFERAAALVKKIDPTRPRNFSQWGPDADGGALEITNHHYPGPKGPEKYRDSKRPVVFDEYCHINAYNRYEQAADPGVRGDWGPLFDRMVTNMYHSKGVLGGAIWVGIDDTFFVPGKGAVGYGTWGVIDGWRREKPEYFGMRKAYSTVRLTLCGNVDKDGKVRVHADNRHLFTNLKECRIEWTAGEAHGTVSPDIAPRTEGDFTISLPQNADRSNLEIRVFGVRGYEIDHYLMQLHPNFVAVDKTACKPHKQKVSCEESANALVVTRGNTKWTVSKTDGHVNITEGNDTIISSATQLMLIPLNGEGGGIQMTGGSQTFEPYNPVCKYWVASSIKCERTADGIDVRVEGAYEEAEGTYVWHIGADGTQALNYKFTVSQDVNPRQVGVMFTLPRSFSHLAWERKGYWNWYPAYDIARLKGEADAFNPNIAISGLAGPSTQPSNDWEDDQTANGSNAFRSTKRNILNATLSSTEGGHSVTINGGGKQHLRSWIDGMAIRMLVADYTNGGHDTYFVSHAEQEYRPLHSGDTVEGVINMTIE